MAQPPLHRLPARPGPEPTGAAATPTARSTAGLPWRAVREEELREIDRERALRHLLLEIGALCARSTDPEELIRGILRRLVTGLDLAAAWVAVPAGASEDVVYSTFGPAPEPEALRAFVAGLAPASPESPPLRLPPAETARLPDPDAAGEGILAAFRVTGPDCGWLLLVAGEHDAVAADVDDLLPAAAALLGGSLARIGALASLRRLNRQLEVEVARRTADLVREKDTLELRVRERTVELEMAKRAVLDSERRLLDMERQENVRQLAAGIAHQINNPLGAVSATMDFLREEIAELVAGRPLSGVALADLREAVADVGADLARIRDLVAGLFGESASQRLAAVRTSLDEAVAHAIRHFRRGAPPGALLETRLASCATVGIPAGELTRWVFRLLSFLLGSRGGAVRIETLHDGDERAVRLEAPGRALAAAQAALGPLAEEIETAGGRLSVAGDDRAVRIRVDLPAGCGEAAPSRDRETRSHTEAPR